MHHASDGPCFVPQLMRCMQTRQHVQSCPNSDGKWYSFFAGGSSCQELGESFTLDVLHDEVVAALARADFQDGDDVRMVNPRRQSRLVEEHLDELFLALQVRVK